MDRYQQKKKNALLILVSIWISDRYLLIFGIGGN